MPPSKETTKILFVYSTLASFVRTDLEILTKHFNVKKMQLITFIVPRRGRDPLVFFKLVKGILSADVVYAWWADLNAFFLTLFCTILGKKSVVVVGGYEVAYVPQMDYGSMLEWRSACVVKCVLRFAHRILAVSRFSRREIRNYVTDGKVELLYLGVDCERFKPCGEKQNDLVLMVGPIAKQDIKIHGLDTFVKAAELLPKTKFLAIGLSKDAINSLSRSSPPNVTLMGIIAQKDLIPYYQRARVYCQLSFRESFGMSLAEAMCSECVPVVTKDGGAMSEVVGNTGFFARFGEATNVAEMIMRALKSEKGIEARERIIKHFSAIGRETALVDLMQKIVT
jgi:glycosyltransferase involved in cell wall biosynthesis